MKRSCILLIASLLLAATSRGQKIDQSQLGASLSYILYGGGGGAGAAQTFTVGKQGILSRIDLRLHDVASIGSVSILLCPVTNGSINYFGALYSTTLQWNALPASPNWLELDLGASSFPVNVGSQFAIVVVTHNGSGFLQNAQMAWDCSDDSSYSGGSLSTFALFVNSTATGFDGAFRTWVTLPEVTATQAYLQGFETGDGNWVAGSNWTFPATGGALNGGHYAAMNAPPTNGSYTGTLTSPQLDFGRAPSDAELSFRYRLQASIIAGITNLHFEIDRGDGQGFAAIPGTYFDFLTGSGAWTPVTVPLTGVSGRPNVHLRVVGTVATNTFVIPNQSSSLGIDEIEIRVPSIPVSPTMPYACNLETLPGWASDDPDWEKGFPAQSSLYGVHSGSTAWATGLFANYAPDADARLWSPRFEFQAFTGKAMFEFAVNAALAAGDRLEVEFDRLDGNGPQVLPHGTVVGNSSGWVLRRVELPLVSGQVAGQIILHFRSDASLQDAGVAVDDMRIFQPTYSGSASLGGDDLVMEVWIDGQRASGSLDSGMMTAGKHVSILTYSGSGILDGGDYFLVGEVFQGSPSFSRPALDIWFSLGAGTVLLDGGFEAPFYAQAHLSPWGEVCGYSYPGGAAGWNCLVQAFVVKPGFTQNGFYASSDAFLLEFN